MSDKKEASVGFSGILAAAATGLLAGLVVVLSAALFYLEFTGLTVDSVASGYLGTLGDFVGGILNPIAAVLSVGLLAYTLRQNSVALKMSRDELQLTRQELEKQANSLKDSARIQRDTLAAESYRARSRMLWERFERIQQYPVIESQHLNPPEAKKSIIDLLVMESSGNAVYVGRPETNSDGHACFYPEVIWTLKKVDELAFSFIELLRANYGIDEVELDSKILASDLDRIFSLFQFGLYSVAVDSVNNFSLSDIDDFSNPPEAIVGAVTEVKITLERLRSQIRNLENQVIALNSDAINSALEAD